MMNLFKWSYSQFLFSWNIVSNLLNICFTGWGSMQEDALTICLYYHTHKKLNFSWQLMHPLIYVYSKHNISITRRIHTPTQLEEICQQTHIQWQHIIKLPTWDYSTDIERRSQNYYTTPCHRQTWSSNWGIQVFPNHTGRNKCKWHAPTIFARCAAFHVCSSSSSDHSTYAPDELQLGQKK